ncbi:MAG: DUF3656 domain-containing protein [Planctomycetota bacterium]|nr:DUF3656 domain-containing protein [Planctomycetota bacterium]
MGSVRAPELLAPAGGPDAAYAALQYGADAVYCGLPRFSARADAENFTLEQLSAIAGFAHAQTPRRRVYATVNTLVLQSELPALIETLAALSYLGVDALIVQDLGVARVAREHFPELRLHASTQLAIHNGAGAAAARDFGFSRVTLARELTLDEIRRIAALPDVEAEVFIHGALCYSYSGLCLFSSQVLGRSGNRGRCAQPCRALYRLDPGGSRRDASGAAAGETSAVQAAGCAFSMKDLALPEHVTALCDAGASSFKIEGRKKNALYVAAVTRFYRGLLDGTLSAAERAACAADIQTIFSRPWTRLFIQSHHEQAGADAARPSHRGTPVGTVESVAREKHGAFWLRFRSARALEYHDGLQVELPGPGRPFGFSIEKLRILEEAETAHDSRAGSPCHKRREVFEAPAGARVEVQLPAGFPMLPGGATICCSSSQAVKRRYRFPKPRPGEYRVRREVEVRVEIGAGHIRATGRAAGRSAAEADVSAGFALAGDFAPARDSRRQEAAARQAFAQLGATALTLGRFEFRNPEGRFVPVSQWKELRRAWAGEMEKALAAAQAQRVERAQRDTLKGCMAAGAPSPNPLPTGERGEGSERRRAARARTPVPPQKAFQWALKVDRLSFLAAFENEDWEDLDEVVVEIARDPLEGLAEGVGVLARKVGRERIRLALPIVTRAWEEEELRGKVAALRGAGWARWEAANLSAWRSLDLNVPAFDVSSDWPVYVLNLAAARAVLGAGVGRVTLSPEDGLANYRALLEALGPRATVVVYQDTPLFLSETCAYANLRGGCAGPARCERPVLQLVSGFGDRLLAVTERCRTAVVNQRPFCLAGRWRELLEAGARRLRADFIVRPYSAEEVRSLWRLLRSGQAPAASHVGNFDRGLL